MSLLTVTSIFCLFLSTGFATYESGFKPSTHIKPHYDAHKDRISEPKIHLDSPKIILNRPSINVHEPAPLHEDEPIILAHDKPLYIRKSLHGIPAGQIVSAAHPAPVPVLLGGGYSHGKVLDITAPIQVINHAPIVHERPILIRRPVVVSKSLAGTQDHLEKLHYAHSGLIHSGGYSHGEFAVPVSKALHERTVVYGGLSHGYGGLSHGGLTHGYGAHIAPAYYNAPLILEQPKAYGHSDIGLIATHGGHLHAHGGHLHGHGGHLHGHGGHSQAHGDHLHAAHLKKY